MGDIRDVAACLRPYVEPEPSKKLEDEAARWIPDARIVIQDTGEVRTATPSAFAAEQRHRIDADFPRGQIASIDVVGTIVSARVERSGPNNARFSQLFSLIRRDGVWRIAGAVCDTHGAEESTVEYYASVDRTLNAYSESFRTGDGRALRPFWYDHARVVGSLHSEPVNRDPDAFCRLITQVKSQPDFVARVAAVTYSGPAACARIEIKDWKGVRYTDFLLLFREEGKWRISQKVFDAHEQR